ncbi:MAG TPA: peptidase U32 family protein [Bacteroidales bacterium]|nr:peptidase U32 family protein [Bacteroidales bacterium]
MEAKDIEIMAPVGSKASLYAAIQGGADAVYFGAGHLNMRSKSSQNFSLADLKEIAAICRQNKVRSYLTMNTIIYDNELEQVEAALQVAKDSQIDAIIAADFSVIQKARELGMEVHISTQSNITNIEAVKFFAQFADVMVTARELNLNQVAEITKAIEKEKVTGPSGELVQIEVFAHGALCMAVSGKCYLSLHTMNSSANRGACLQPCRRAYDVKDKDSDIELEVDNEYIMSPKDLKTVHFLNKILDAGVRVLKIEGRGRSPEYVKTVSSVYRKAVNAYFSGEFGEPQIREWDKELEKVYNRGFWNGYYLGQRLGEWTEKYGSQATQKKLYLGKVTNYFSKIGVAEVKVDTNELELNDNVVFIGDTTGVHEEKVKEIRIELSPVQKAVKGDVFSIPVSNLVRRGDKMYKVIEVENQKRDFLSNANND